MENNNVLEDEEIIDGFIEKTKNETMKWTLVKGTFPTNDYYSYELSNEITVELFWYKFTFYTYDGAEIPSIGYKLSFALKQVKDRYIKEIYDEEMGHIFKKLKELYTLVETKQHNLDNVLKKFFGI